MQAQHLTAAHATGEHQVQQHAVAKYLEPTDAIPLTRVWQWQSVGERDQQWHPTIVTG